MDDLQIKLRAFVDESTAILAESLEMHVRNRIGSKKMAEISKVGTTNLYVWLETMRNRPNLRSYIVDLFRDRHLKYVEIFSAYDNRKWRDHTEDDVFMPDEVETFINHVSEFLDVLQDHAHVDKMRVLHSRYHESLTQTEELMMLKKQPYTMGNAGDLIKHGSLVLLLEWMSKRRDKITYADPFGGNPWGQIVSDEVRRRLNLCDLMDRAWDGENIYYGSGQIAKTYNADVWTSDMDEERRVALKESGLNLLDDGFPSVYDGNNGYSILSSEFTENFDVILIDPLDDFLVKHLRQFDIIQKRIEAHPDLFIMVFVLDWQPLGKTPLSAGIYEVHKRLLLKKKMLRKYLYSLRCPKLSGDHGLIGESMHEAEIMIMSQQIADGKCGDLRDALQSFAKLATRILPLQSGESVKFFNNTDELPQASDD